MKFGLVQIHENKVMEGGGGGGQNASPSRSRKY